MIFSHQSTVITVWLEIKIKAGKALWLYRLASPWYDRLWTMSLSVGMLENFHTSHSGEITNLDSPSHNTSILNDMQHNASLVQNTVTDSKTAPDFASVFTHRKGIRWAGFESLPTSLWLIARMIDSFGLVGIFGDKVKSILKKCKISACSNMKMI